MGSLSFDLNGKVALVTGGTSGIGKATAEGLLAAGASVVVGSRKEEKVAAAQKDLSAVAPSPDRAVARHLDVTEEASVEAAMDQCIESFGRVDILINCAGANLKKPSLEVTAEEHKWIFDVNYFGAFYAAQAFARRCIQQGPVEDGSGGYSIVNICSVTSFLALSEVTTYAASKGALLALTRQLAVEWPKLYDIRVNAIAPGFVPADQNRQILKSGDRGRRILESLPMERFADPEEMAGAVVFLCSPAGRYLNGECINVDGGFMIHGVSDSEASSDA